MQVDAARRNAREDVASRSIAPTRNARRRQAPLRSMTHYCSRMNAPLTCVLGFWPLARKRRACEGDSGLGRGRGRFVTSRAKRACAVGWPSPLRRRRLKKRCFPCPPNDAASPTPSRRPVRASSPRCTFASAAVRMPSESIGGAPSSPTVSAMQRSVSFLKSIVHAVVRHCAFAASVVADTNATAQGSK